MTLTAEKSALRRAALDARTRAASADDLEQAAARANRALGAVLAERFGTGLRGIVLSGYMPMRGEIDPLPAMRAHPGPVCVPVVVAKGAPLEFRRWTDGCAMEVGAFRALIPRDGEVMVPQALIVPMVAFDRRGARLGYGGGFYDRTLAVLRRAGPVLAIGLAHAAQEVAELPIGATDMPLDAVVTPEAVIWPEAAERSARSGSPPTRP